MGSSAMRVGLLLVVLLTGCYRLPEPTTALDGAADRAEVAAAAAAWIVEGQPDPAGCEPMRVLHPASPAQLIRYCKQCSCEQRDCGISGICVDACSTTIAEGFGPFIERVPVAVVSRTQPRHSYVHELGHHWQRCLHLIGDPHPPWFRHWLKGLGR